jgi:hypothetical protein
MAKGAGVEELGLLDAAGILKPAGLRGGEEALARAHAANGPESDWERT